MKKKGLLLIFLFLSLINFAMARPSGAALEGCLRCHSGIEQIIEGNMYQALLSFAKEEKRGYACVICHEGNPDGKTEEEAHAGIYPNPGNMWVVSKGKGCGKCHSDSGALTTLMTKPIKATGGSLMSVETDVSDPSAASGKNHVYRMQRALMALETGKANKTLFSNGVTKKGSFIYSDFDMDDPDGAVPTAGSAAYKKWIKKAISTGLIKRLKGTKEIPEYDKGVNIFKSPSDAAFADMHRKQCARCHVWGEGRGKRGDHRAGGCSACHVLYNNDGVYEGSDKNIPKTGAHPMKHKITLNIPAQQCTHCHTRGKRIGTTYTGMFEYDYRGGGAAPPWNNKDGKAQKKLFTKEFLNIRKDIHLKRGMHCVDCHTSIDVHGDGNIYPVTFFQVEIGCADCHGTPTKYPWELPVGYGTGVLLNGERGTYKTSNKEYMITTRGNARKNWVKEGNNAYILSRVTKKKIKIPILKSINAKDHFKTKQGKTAMALIPQHIEKLECYACHSIWAPQCFGCHIKYDMTKKGTDWISSAKNRNATTEKQTITKTSGDIAVENRSFTRWESPILGVNYKGRVTPLIPGCQVVWSFKDKNGKLVEVNQIKKTSDGYSAATLAPLQPHANSAVARTCEDCHSNPKTLGYGYAKSRSAGILQGDEPVFQNMGTGNYGDLPSAKNKQPQIPKLKDFPYAWDQLVTRSGKQVQNMPLVKDRPLNAKERKLTEREGTCIACHQHYSSPAWKEIRKKMRAVLGGSGRALTPEEHDRAIEEILKSFINTLPKSTNNKKMQVNTEE